MVSSMRIRAIKGLHTLLQILQKPDPEGFLTPEMHELLPSERQSTRKRLTFVTTPSGRYFARKTVEAYNTLLEQNGSAVRNRVALFPAENRQHQEGEFIPRLNESVDGNDVFLFVAPYDPSYIYNAITKTFDVLRAQKLLRANITLDDFLATEPDASPPCEVIRERVSKKLLNANLMEAMIFCRTLNENNAGNVTVVMPYHAYSRQNHATPFKREGILSRLVADLLVTSGANGILSYDPHSDDIAGFYPPGVTKKMVSPFSSLSAIFAEYKGREDVAFIFLDEGCSKRYGKLVESLGIRSVYLSKIRETRARVEEISGELERIRLGLFADDIIGTGGTIKEGVEKLHGLGIPRFVGACSHPLFVGNAPAILASLHRDYGLKTLHVPDTVPQSRKVLSLPFINEYTVTRLFAQIINAIHYQRSASRFAHNVL